MAKIVKHLPIWCKGGVKTLQQFIQTTTKKLKITDKILFNSFTNIYYIFYT